MVAFGIDLGTTNSCVAVYNTNGVEVIANNLGHRTTPSMVFAQNSGMLVGTEAKDKQPKGNTIKNVIYDAKRLIGRHYNDREVQSDIQYWPFEVKSDSKNRPFVHIEDYVYKQLYPEEISGAVLKKMKKIAEEFTNKTMRDVVITIPAYFREDQKAGTEQAAKIAGFTKCTLISEPSAAGLAFYYKKLFTDEAAQLNGKIILVYDLGGGTFDVSIMKIDHGRIAVQKIGGDNHLGGNDFDNRLLEYCMKKLEKSGVNIFKDAKARQKLKLECIKAKHQLSGDNVPHFDIYVECLYDGNDFEYTLTRYEFETACKDLFDKTMQIVDDVLKDANLSPSQINDVLLVGGSTRIPKIKEMLATKFDPEKINQSINPDEAVAFGAAVKAAIDNNDIEKKCNAVLLDVSPLSLGTDLTGDKYSVIIPRNTTIPSTRTKEYVTTADNQERVGIQILEGENSVASQNHKLSEYSVTGIPKHKAGEEKVQVTFSLDSNAILSVTTKIVSTGKVANLEVNYNKARLSEEEIQRMLRDLKIN